MTTRQRAREYLVHFVAACKVCEWQTEDYLTGRSAARRHARKTGHSVLAEFGYFTEYEGATIKEDKP